MDVVKVYDPMARRGRVINKVTYIPQSRAFEPEMKW